MRTDKLRATGLPSRRPVVNSTPWMVWTRGSCKRARNGSSSGAKADRIPIRAISSTRPGVGGVASAWAQALTQASEQALAHL